MRIVFGLRNHQISIQLKIKIYKNQRKLYDTKKLEK